MRTTTAERTPGEANKVYENAMKHWSVKPWQVKKALIATADFFEKNPDRFVTGTYVTRPSDPNACYCSIGRFSVEIGLMAGKCHMLLSCLCQRWSQTIPETDPRYNDARFGRVTSLNDIVLGTPEAVAQTLREMAECV